MLCKKLAKFSAALKALEVLYSVGEVAANGEPAGGAGPPTSSNNNQHQKEIFLPRRRESSVDSDASTALPKKRSCYFKRVIFFINFLLFKWRWM